MLLKKGSLFVKGIALAALAEVVVGCGGGGGGGLAGTPPPTGDKAVTYQTVTSVQTLDGGLNFPFMALKASAPSGLKFALGSSALKLSPQTGTYNAALGLYYTETSTGNSITLTFYKDSSETQPAGNIIISAPGLASVGGSYPAYPATIQMTANITAGNLIFNGNGKIVFTDANGANTMTGTINMPTNGIVGTIDMTLSDSEQVGGKITIVQNGMTSTMTNLAGDLTTLTGNVSVSPEGWTGTATLGLLTGTFSEKLNGAGAQPIQAGLNSSGNLIINYPDGTNSTVANPISDNLSTNSGGGGTITNPTITINWPARSRSISGPQSALSAILTFPSGTADGGIDNYYVTRDSNIAAHTETYTVSYTFDLGTYPMTADFYSTTDASGPVVATAGANVTFTASALSVANIVFTENVAKVAVTSTSVPVGAAPALLQFAASDASGNAIALTPGSAFWALKSGGTYLSLAADGTASGIAAGNATVVATVDGVPSPVSTIQVKAATSNYLAPVPISGPTGFTISRVLPTGQMVGTAGSEALYWSSPTAQPTTLPGIAGSSRDTADCLALVNGKLEVVGSSGGFPAVWTSLTSAPTLLSSDIYGSQNGALSGEATSINSAGHIVALLSSGEGALYWSSPTAPFNLIPNSQEGLTTGAAQGEAPYLDSVNQIGYFIQNGFPGYTAAISPNDSTAATYLPGMLKYTNGAIAQIGRYMTASGVIYGSDYKTQGGILLPVYWSSADSFKTEHLLTPLSAGTDCEPLAANESGWVVGDSADNGAAVLWKTPTTPVDVSTLLPANSGWTLDEGNYIFGDGSLVVTAYAPGGSAPILAYVKAN